MTVSPSALGQDPEAIARTLIDGLRRQNAMLEATLFLVKEGVLAELDANHAPPDWARVRAALNPPQEAIEAEAGRLLGAGPS